MSWRGVRWLRTGQTATMKKAVSSAGKLYPPACRMYQFHSRPMGDAILMSSRSLQYARYSIRSHERASHNVEQKSTSAVRELCGRPVVLWANGLISADF